MSNDQIQVIHTRVFAAGPNGGNPCPVILFADRLTDSDMQSVAKKFGLDTAFLLQPRTQETDLRIRYFVPDHEMGVSGHATIAALTVALHKKTVAHNRVRIETSSGLFEAEWILQGDGYLVTLEQNPPAFDAIVPVDEVARALNIDASKIASAESPIQAVSVSRAKLLIPLEDWRALNGLSPNFEVLWQLCDAQQVTGLYPFTRHSDKRNADAEARQFPNRAGFPEDAATGVAAAALAAYLARYDLGYKAGRHEFRIAQGYAMGTPSLIEAIAECSEGSIKRTAIRGMAKIIRREHIWV